VPPYPYFAESIGGAVTLSHIPKKQKEFIMLS